MNTKIRDVYFIRRQSAGSAVQPQVFEAEDEGDTKTEPTVATMTDSVRPLLTSMKLFGLYFKCGTDTSYKVADGKLRRHCNGYMIYSLVLVIVMWIDVARVFSVFKRIVSVFVLRLFTSLIIGMDDFLEVDADLSCVVFSHCFSSVSVYQWQI